MDATPAKPFRVVFRLSEADWRAFVRDHERAKPWLARMQSLIMTILLMIVTLGMTGLWVLGRGRASGLIVPLLMLAIWPFMIVSGRRATARKIRESGLFDADMVVELVPEGVRHEDFTGQSLAYWRSVKAFDETASAFTITLEGNRCILVPKPAFAGETDAHAFAAEARSRLEAART